MDWIEAGGVALRYEHRAASRACPTTVVLIHELGGSLESWDALMSWLPPAGGVLRYDCRGSGLSEKIRGTASLDEAADDLLGLIRALGIAGPVALVGSALGAAIAIRFATCHPGEAMALALLAPATSTVAAARSRFLERAEQLEAGGFRGATPPERLEHVLREVMPPDLLEDEAVMRSARARYWHPDPFSYAAYCRMLAELDLEKELPLVVQPTLVLAGTFDQVRPPERVRTVANAIPDAIFEVVASGHMMAWQHPDLVGPIVRNFIDIVSHVGPSPPDGSLPATGSR